MKSAERHKLETNWLAIHLDQWIERLRPYSSTITGSIIAVVVLGLAWWYFSGTSSAHTTDAWNIYNSVLGGPLNDQAVTELAKNSEDYSDTDMYPWARLTTADGQLWIASRTVLQDRAGAMKKLDDAASKYQSVIGSSQDEQLVDRAHFGMARVHEMRNEPDKAREEYLKVKGTFAVLAKRRAEELTNEKTKQSLAWLATAEAPRFTTPRSSIIPGSQPGLNVDDIKLPGATGATDPTKTDLNIDEMLKGLGIDMGKDTGPTTDRYKTDDAAKEGDATKQGDAAKPGDAVKPADAPATGTPVESKPASGEAPKQTTDKGKSGGSL